MRATSFVLIGALVAAVSLTARSQQSTFRAGVELVSVDVSVLDGHRQPLEDLSARDFTVFEDGKPRDVVAFTPVSLPTRVIPPAPWMADIAPDVATNDLAHEGRLVVILIDRSVTPEQAGSVRKVALATVDQLRDTDLAAIAYSASGIPQNFTADRQRLRDAIERPFATLPEGDDGSPSECYCGACSLETVARIAESFRDVPERRKLLFYLGSRLPIQSASMCGGPLSAARDRVFRAADVANLTIYVFDPSGLQGPAVGSAASSARPPMVPPSLARLSDLSVLPSRTGGRVLRGNDPSTVLADVFRESGAYYVLGFQPASSASDGRFHQITVRVNRPGAIVQARRGYYAPGGTPTRAPAGVAATPEMSGAIAGLWPAGGLPLVTSAAAFAAPGLGEAFAVVTLGVGAGAPFDGTVKLVTGAFDRNGSSLASVRQDVSVSAASRTQELVAKLPLRPGRYEIRSAVDAGHDRPVGSVYTYLDVPDFRREPVSLSGVLLEEGDPTGANPTGALRDLVPVSPTTRRAFRTSDHVRAFLQVYEGVSQAILPVYLRVRVVNDANREIVSQETRIDAGRFSASRAIDFEFELPLDRLTSGAYWTSIEVTHGNARVSRDVRFAVVDGS